MADISTAVSMARVPILGENGRISDDYIPAAIGEGVESAEAAATRAESAATDAEGSASAADQSATQAAGSASAASASASRAQQSATTAGSAATFAQSAQTAAEEAKTAAEAAQSAAAGSAQDAQQSATAAHQSAASVADKFIASAQATTLEPGSQATASVENQVLTIGVPKGDKGDQGEKGDTGTGVPEGGEPGQLLSKTDSGTAWVDPPSGNVLKGTLGPAPILSADDAYATTPRRLTVYGKTVQNLWMNPSGTKTQNGITVTPNSDGSITVSGTSTSPELIELANSYVLKPGAQYTFSVNKLFPTDEGKSSGGFYIQRHASGKIPSTIGYLSSGGEKEIAVNVPSDTEYCAFGVQAIAGSQISGTYRVMLNEGSTAQPWCPPGLHSVEPKELVTAGKNLLDFSKFNPTYYDVSGDGLKIVKTDDQAWDNIQPMLQLPPGDYTFICEGAERQQIGIRNVGGTDWNIRASSPIHMSTPFEIVFKVFADVDTVVYPQLELGSTATAYEPPNITTTPLPEVELRSLPDGTCDELVIAQDGTATVERRTHSYTATGEESVFYTSFDSAYFDTGIPFTWVSGASVQVYCDKLPTAQTSVKQVGCMIGTIGSTVIVYFKVAGTITDVDTAKAWLTSNTPTFVFVRNQTTEPQSPVTLPVLPAPTFNVYHDSDVPSDTTVTYERDVTIAFDKLQAQVSATTVREATNG